MLLSVPWITDLSAVLFVRWVISSTVGLKEHLLYVFLFVALLSTSWSKAKVSGFTWVKNVKCQHFPTQLWLELIGQYCLPLRETHGERG